MGKQRNTRIRKRYLAIYLYMLLILLTLLTAASYTWFSLSQTPRVSDVYLYVNAPTGLELSETPDAEEWELQLDYGDLVGDTVPLRPVTWSEADQRFYAAVYGVDGRRTDQWEPLSDSRNANKNNLDGFYIKATFYARAGQAVDVALSPAVEVDEGLQGSGTYLVGYPLWDSEEIVHRDGGRGGQRSVRVGIRTTPVDSTGTPTGAQSGLYIYEPNCEASWYAGELQYVNTPSIDGTETLVPENRLILQTSSLWRDIQPVQRNVVMHTMGDFITDTRLFSLKQGEIARIDLYIWLEGQDPDCTNEISKSQIMASIQFKAEGSGQSGMQPIE